MRLVITQDGVGHEFVRHGVDGPYPWLGKVGTLLLAARAGHLDNIGVAESANVTVELTNDRRQAATLLGRPVRAAAALYDDAGDMFFAGLIQQVGYGTTMVVSIEA